MKWFHTALKRSRDDARKMSEVDPLDAQASTRKIPGRIHNSRRVRLTPPHSRVFHPFADDRLARRLDGARTDLPALGSIVRIVHSMVLVAEVGHNLFPGRTLPGISRDVQALEPVHDGCSALVFEPMCPLRMLFFSRRGLGGAPCVGEVSQVLRGMVEVQDHRVKAAEVASRQIFQPRSAIAQGDPRLRSAMPTWPAWWRNGSATASCPSRLATYRACHGGRRPFGSSATHQRPLFYEKFHPLSRRSH